ncbi:MAG: GNAT family N-acetyltransferase [Capnocytophaga sp.]|nr:GNAT family N-acetyltransferase [Capnocytophaga sp.]
MKIEREENGKKGRFVIYEDSQFAGEMTYTQAGEDKIIIDHTGVDKNFGGKGYGKKMVLEAVVFARANQLKILPLCPFAKAEFDKNKDYQDVRF